MSSANGVLTVIPAPEGYAVDFSHPTRQGVAEIYWIVAVGNVLALMFLAQKLYTKIIIDRRFQLDDGELSSRAKSYYIFTGEPDQKVSMSHCGVGMASSSCPWIAAPALTYFRPHLSLRKQCSSVRNYSCLLSIHFGAVTVNTSPQEGSQLESSASMRGSYLSGVTTITVL